jgi:hypothetical protein
MLFIDGLSLSAPYCLAAYKPDHGTMNSIFLSALSNGWFTEIQAAMENEPDRRAAEHELLRSVEQRAATIAISAISGNVGANAHCERRCMIPAVEAAIWFRRHL